MTGDDWAVLTDPNKRGNQWRDEAIFRTSVAEIDSLMGALSEVFLACQRERPSISAADETFHAQ